MPYCLLRAYMQEMDTIHAAEELRTLNAFMIAGFHVKDVNAEIRKIQTRANGGMKPQQPRRMSPSQFFGGVGVNQYAVKTPKAEGE